MPISSSAKTRLAPPGWPGQPWGSFAGKTPAAPPAAVRPVQLEAHGPVHVPPYVEYVPTALYIEPMVFALPSRWRVEVSDWQAREARCASMPMPRLRFSVPPLATLEGVLIFALAPPSMEAVDPVDFTDAPARVLLLARSGILTCDDAIYTGERRRRIMSEIYELLGVR